MARVLEGQVDRLLSITQFMGMDGCYYFYSVVRTICVG
jgi:hypothetical protein